MDNVKSNIAEMDVVTGILHSFIERLRADKTISPATIERLTQALLIKQEVSVEKLREALFSRDET